MKKPVLTLLVSCVSIIKLWTCFSARVSSNFLETTATSNAVQPAPFNIGSILNQLFFGWLDKGLIGYEHGVESTHHDAGRDSDTSTAIRVGHDVTVADAQKRDGNQPHGVEKIGVLLVVVPAQQQQQQHERNIICKNMLNVSIVFKMYRSHWRSVQLAMIHNDTMKTRRTVPGQMVIRVFRTNRVLKLMRLRAPIDLDDASVNSLLINKPTRRQVEREREQNKTMSKLHHRSILVVSLAVQYSYICTTTKEKRWTKPFAWLFFCFVLFCFFVHLEIEWIVHGGGNVTPNDVHGHNWRKQTKERERGKEEEWRTNG